MSDRITMTVRRVDGLGGEATEAASQSLTAGPALCDTVWSAVARIVDYAEQMLAVGHPESLILARLSAVDPHDRPIHDFSPGTGPA